MKKTDFRFTKWEWGLWSVSVTVILLSFFAFGGDDLLTLTAAVTFAFWWILKAFHTANLFFSGCVCRNGRKRSADAGFPGNNPHV